MTAQFAWDTAGLAAADKRFLWHPFTQMRAWCDDGHEPLVLVGGEGAILRDSGGREYIDGNSSIWTNIHGHGHPRIAAAVAGQISRLDHCSFLGSTNPPAIELAARLVGLFPENTLTRVFYSDDGSTAIEVALKMAAQYWQLAGEPGRRRFVAFDRAYHGDTAGAAGLGGIPAFYGRFAGMPFPVDHVADLAALRALPGPDSIAAVVIEPLIQGAAGMRLWPRGMLRELREWCDANGVLLILDEVMTGFGRTGRMFACEHEAVVPDFIALAKGLTGGVLPLAATLTTERVFEAFLGETAEQKTFYYGHSYAGNPIGCAAALASLEIFREERVLENLAPKIARMASLLDGLRDHPHVGEIRQCGFIAGIDLVECRRTRRPYAWDALTGARVCHEARRHGLLTRPVLDTLVLMPPLCATGDQLAAAVDALREAIRVVCGN